MRNASLAIRLASTPYGRWGADVLQRHCRRLYHRGAFADRHALE